MKLFFVFVYVFFAGISYAQLGNNRDNDPQKKLEQLEKIKLLQILNLEDEASVKFFNRRKIFKESQKELIGRSETLLKEIESLMNDKNVSTPESLYKSKIQEYNKILDDLTRIRTDFVNSLFEIIPAKEIAKFIVFEKRFKEEIRDLILKEKGKRFQGNTPKDSEK